MTKTKPIGLTHYRNGWTIYRDSLSWVATETNPPKNESPLHLGRFDTLERALFAAQQRAA